MGWRLELELLLRNAGLVLVAFCMLAMIHGSASSRAELQRFKYGQNVLAAESQRLVPRGGVSNFTVWPRQRIRKYQESLAAHYPPAVGILRIAKIKLEVPILEGTNPVTLNRGVGHVVGTANVGDVGNMAIAGHRDGFFRGLKDIRFGDAIEVTGLRETKTYLVDRIIVVDPSDVSVLRPRTRSVLTLITCFPFHYIGSAPKRYIVQASAVDSAPVKLPGRAGLGYDAVPVGSAAVGE